ncbi:MAG: PQQ-binding-like beta-propeller repeat protein [Deltaproteobacteria bacterium]|nr:PQQ-binding-like beta-propeller repeat protein [Deltaproteobacteria bacterium]
MILAAAALWVDVAVYEDRNGDGQREAGEPGVAGAVVGVGVIEAEADAEGVVHLLAEPGDPIWARAFDGYALPGPWAPVPAVGPGERAWVALGLVPRPAPSGPWTFVVAADPHIQKDGDPVDAHTLAPIFDQATGATPTPDFVLIAGDVTQGTTVDQAESLFAMVATSPAPVVIAPGNHDWYDNGELWRARFGPDQFSFTHGGVHVLVLNLMLPLTAQIRFVRNDLATARPTDRVIAVIHGPPETELAEVLGAAGVEIVIAGHWHANRILRRDGFLELDTEPWVMGGMDQTPAGYRVIEVDPEGGGRAALSVRHFPSMETPLLALVGPAPGQCVAPGAPVTLVAAAAAGPALDAVSVAIDGGPMQPMAWRGGLDWVRGGPALAPGAHTIALRGGGLTAQATIEVCAREFADLAALDADDRDWPQLGGGPARTGMRARALGANLVPRWVTAVGGHLVAGSPVVAGDLVIVAAIDLADDQTSAVVALELATGAIRWRFAPGAAVRNAVAVGGDTVVAATVDGAIWGLDRATGLVRWRTDLARGVRPEEATTWGAPLVIGELVVAGNQRRLAGLDLATGRVRWAADPVPDTRDGGSFASPATGGPGEVVVTAPNRALGGVIGYDPVTGAEQWRSIDICTLSIAASPVVDGAIAHLLSGATERCTVELATGETGSWGPLTQKSFEWAYEVAATEAVGPNAMVAATEAGEVFGLDPENEHMRWARSLGAVSPIHPAHYRAATRAVAGAPVIAGPWAWVPGTDGAVTALDLMTGAARARLEVGAPITSGLALAGDALVVASFDGTVRLYQAPLVRRSPWPMIAEAGAVLAGGGALVLIARRRRRKKKLRPTS